MALGKIIRVYYELEIKCLLCSRSIGFLETSKASGISGILKVPRKPNSTSHIKNWQDLRCEDCKGTVYADTIVEHIDREKTELSEAFPKPRRGRSPRKFNNPVNV
jgi:hypothetical protein